MDKIIILDRTENFGTIKTYADAKKGAISFNLQLLTLINLESFGKSVKC